MMATLELIKYFPSDAKATEAALHMVSTERVPPVQHLPQIVWKNGDTWGEANIWALEQAKSCRRDPKTVLSAMSHLLAYAKWLESEEISWAYFPARESERCLTRYRGVVVYARNSGTLAPSTASARMATVVRFYRWVEKTKLISLDWPMWSERQIGIKLTDSFGFEHSLRIHSTDLAIPNRHVASAVQLEDGLLPVSIADMNEILSLADNHASEELALLLRIGFQTGLRIGSITDLKVQTIRNASRDPVAGWYRLDVGPAARPTVQTKFGVSGKVPIPDELRERLLDYSTSTRHLKRQALAAPEHKTLLFLSRFGTPYTGNQSRAINVELGRLRKVGKAKGIKVLNGFYFHRSRATFATMLARAALKFMSIGDAIQFVRGACLHKDEATSLKYIKFIEASKAMSEAANAFSEAFMGLAKETGKHDPG
jgi:integrase